MHGCVPTAAGGMALSGAIALAYDACGGAARVQFAVTLAGNGTQLFSGVRLTTTSSSDTYLTLTAPSQQHSTGATLSWQGEQAPLRADLPQESLAVKLLYAPDAYKVFSRYTGSCILGTAQFQRSTGVAFLQGSSDNSAAQGVAVIAALPDITDPTLLFTICLSALVPTAAAPVSVRTASKVLLEVSDVAELYTAHRTTTVVARPSAETLSLLAGGQAYVDGLSGVSGTVAGFQPGAVVKRRGVFVGLEPDVMSGDWASQTETIVSAGVAEVRESGQASVLSVQLGYSVLFAANELRVFARGALLLTHALDGSSAAVVSVEWTLTTSQVRTRSIDRSIDRLN